VPSQIQIMVYDPLWPEVFRLSVNRVRIPDDASFRRGPGIHLALWVSEVFLLTSLGYIFHILR
jgi:hypothetical protein